MRHKVLVVVGAVLVLAFAACGSSTSTASAFEANSPGAILSTAVRAATRLEEVHYVLRTSGTSTSQTVTGDAATNQGAEYVVSGSDEAVIQLIGSTAYIKGNAGGLQDIIGLGSAQATRYAGQWVSLQPTDSMYRSVVQSVTLQGVLGNVKPRGSLEKSTPVTLGGRSVVGVRGGLADATEQGSATMWVATATPNVPVGVEAQTTSGSEIGVFSKWGERFRFEAPSGAVAFSAPPTK